MEIVRNVEHKFTLYLIITSGALLENTSSHCYMRKPNLIGFKCRRVYQKHTLVTVLKQLFKEFHFG